MPAWENRTVPQGDARASGAARKTGKQARQLARRTQALSRRSAARAAKPRSHRARVAALTRTSGRREPAGVERRAMIIINAQSGRGATAFPASARLPTRLPRGITVTCGQAKEVHRRSPCPRSRQGRVSARHCRRRRRHGVGRSARPGRHRRHPRHRAPRHVQQHCHQPGHPHRCT